MKTEKKKNIPAYLDFLNKELCAQKTQANTSEQVDDEFLATVRLMVDPPEQSVENYFFIFNIEFVSGQQFHKLLHRQPQQFIGFHRHGAEVLQEISGNRTLNGARIFVRAQMLFPQERPVLSQNSVSALAGSVLFLHPDSEIGLSELLYTGKHFAFILSSSVETKANRFSPSCGHTE